MADIKFDHSKKDLFEAIGLGEKGKEELCEKQAELATKMITGELTVTSELAEEIANTYSYSELVAAATNELIHKTADSMAKHPRMLMRAILSGFKM